MRDVGHPARVVDAVGRDSGPRWGGGPRGTLLHQAAWLGRPDSSRCSCAQGAGRRAGRDEVGHAAGLVRGRLPLQPGGPQRQLLLLDPDWVGVARLLVDAGAHNQARFAEMALPPLSDWLASH